MAMNEAGKQPAMNLSLARVYLRHSDPMVATRTWQNVLDEIIGIKTGPTQARWKSAAKDKAFDLIRNRVLIETQAEHLLAVLRTGTVSTNVFLRKVHNFAVDMNWLPATVIPRRQWPAIHYKEKRAITLEEHQKIIAAEVNPERKTLYQLCWHLGASQGDIANLKGEDVDWTNNTVSFTRKKTGVPVLVHLGGEALNLFKDLPGEGPLFPYLSRVRAGDRATEFGSRCRQLGINGVTLHSYRYAWAERAKTVGYPGTVRAGGFGPQQQGRASRLRETGPDENSVIGRLRATDRAIRLIYIPMPKSCCNDSEAICHGSDC